MKSTLTSTMKSLILSKTILRTIVFMSLQGGIFNTFAYGQTINENQCFDKNWFQEVLHDGWGQVLKIDQVLYQNNSFGQNLIVFKNSKLGTVLALDGVVQVTDKDEYPYSEMIAHVPILSHGNVKKVLIVGGGDGAVLREIVKYKQIEEITMAEIDPSVIEMSKTYFPTLSQGAFEDKRFRLKIGDAAKFIKEDTNKYDVIISDSTDPIGPGAVLFTEEFYKDCKEHLNPGGILVTQNGVPNMQPEELKNTYDRQHLHFKDNSFYLVTIPSYVGGAMALSWATDNAQLRKVSAKTLTRRLQEADIKTKYYTPEVHKASFALPMDVKNLIMEKKD